MKHYGVAASGLARRVRKGDRMCWLTVTEAELMGKREGQLQQKPREGTPWGSVGPCVYPCPRLPYSGVDMCFWVCLCPLH